MEQANNIVDYGEINDYNYSKHLVYIRDTNVNGNMVDKESELPCNRKGEIGIICICIRIM